MSLRRWFVSALLAVTTFILGVAVAPRLTHAVQPTGTSTPQQASGGGPYIVTSMPLPNSPLTVIVNGSGDVYAVGLVNNVYQLRKLGSAK
jgi:hypothetical protein